MRRLLPLLLLVLFGCASPGEYESVASTRTGMQVTRLFTHEGCTLYRFHDAGEYIYYSNCGSNAASPVSHYNAATKTTQTKYPMAAGSNHE